MSHIIAIRLPECCGGALVILTDGKHPSDDRIAEFNTKEEAETAAGDNLLCQTYGYEVLEIDV